jgi:hypothetical protein
MCSVPFCRRVSGESVRGDRSVARLLFLRVIPVREG